MTRGMFIVISDDGLVVGQADDLDVALLKTMEHLATGEEIVQEYRQLGQLPYSRGGAIAVLTSIDWVVYYVHQVVGQDNVLAWFTIENDRVGVPLAFGQ